jgi:hypothetical protein
MNKDLQAIYDWCVELGMKPMAPDDDPVMYIKSWIDAIATKAWKYDGLQH